MNNRSVVETVIFQFFEALNIDDAIGVPLTKDVEYYGMFSPAPVCGEADVRDYIQQIAPFMLNEKYKKIIVEEGSVAVIAEFDSVNGLHNEGAFFFEVEDGRISRIRAIFDTRKMFTGKSS